jgi:hypothetical protein
MSPAPPSSTRTASTGPAAPWRGWAEAIDWDTVRTELDATGCALTGALLSATGGRSGESWRNDTNLRRNPDDIR